MRVIAGKAKGHKLVAPKLKTTRPVLDQVKEAVFNILFSVENELVLDLFAGSGAMGIEALSRGAKHCIFVEKERAATTSIHKNLHRCRFMEQAQVFHQSVEKIIDKLNTQKKAFDLIFVDPPYEHGLVLKSLSQLAKSSLLHNETRIIVEHHPKEPIPEIPGLILTDQRQYGQTLVTFLKKSNEKTSDLRPETTD